MPSLRQSVQTRTRFGCSARARDARLALGRRQHAGDRSDLDALGQRRAELLGDVLGRRDEAAEDDRVVAVLEQLLDQLDRLLRAWRPSRRRAAPRPGGPSPAGACGSMRPVGLSPTSASTSPWLGIVQAAGRHVERALGRLVVDRGRAPCAAHLVGFLDARPLPG